MLQAASKGRATITFSPVWLTARRLAEHLMHRGPGADSHPVPLPENYFVEEEGGPGSSSGQSHAANPTYPEARVQALTEQQNIMR